MLASLFSKTKPINYILVSAFLGFIFIVFHLFHFQDFTFYGFIKALGGGLLLILSVFLVQFIVLRNHLVSDNAYVPLLFLCFLMMFPNLLLHTRFIVANFFILLALRRILSLHSLKAPKQKLFDASLWVLVASLFHFWSISFVLLLFIAAAFYVGKELKNWLIPFIAFFVVFVFLSVYLIVTGESYVEWIDSQMQYSFDFTKFSTVYQNLALAIFASLALLFFVSELLNFNKKQFNIQSSYKKVLYSFIIGLVIYGISDSKNEGVILFTFFPLAIMGANYIDLVAQSWRKEAVVFSILGIALFCYLTQLFFL